MPPAVAEDLQPAARRHHGVARAPQPPPPDGEDAQYQDGGEGTLTAPVHINTLPEPT